MMLMESFIVISTKVYGSVLSEFPWISVVWDDSFPLSTLLSHKERKKFLSRDL